MASKETGGLNRPRVEIERAADSFSTGRHSKPAFYPVGGVAPMVSGVWDGVLSPRPNAGISEALAVPA